MTESARPRRWAVPQNHDPYWQRQEGTGPPGYRIGKHLRWRRSDGDAWLEEHKGGRLGLKAGDFLGVD